MAHDGSIALNAQIAKLRRLGPALTKGGAPAVALAVRGELAAQIAAGTGPDGRAWKPTKAGTPPLRNAAAALTVRAVGTVVVATLSGVEARHHLGAVKGKVKREILPTGKIPDPVTRAITRVVTAEFEAIMGGTK